MKNGRFTAEEREYLLSLDAVDEVRATSIVYSREFKRRCMDRYYDGESPGEIFASVGLPASLIGYKRIERAIYHWKEARSKDALTLTAAPQVRHRNQVDTIKRKKRLAVERQRLMRDKERERYEARIAELEAQVQILKAEGVLAKKCGHAGSTLTKSQKFALIAHMTRLNPRARITTLCNTIGVSRSGYYKWKASAPARARRDAEDLWAKELVEEAFFSHGFAKGSRQIKNTLLREKNVVMNRKKIQRIMRRFNIVFRKKRTNPYRHIGKDGHPKIAPNTLERNFHPGTPRTVLLTDITYIPCKEKFCYLSAVLDAQTNEILAHVLSPSLEESFVLETMNQLKGQGLTSATLIHSDQGVHYTAQAYRAKLKELGLTQSMSRKATCWDNAPMESFFGRLKEQLGPTKNLNYTQIQQKINNYINYYNNHRGQQRLNWMTPTEYAATLAA